MIKSKYTEKKKASNKRYIDEKTDRIQMALPKGYSDKLHKIAESQGISMAGFIKKCIDTAYNEITQE